MGEGRYGILTNFINNLRPLHSIYERNADSQVHEPKPPELVTAFGLKNIDEIMVLKTWHKAYCSTIQ